MFQRTYIFHHQNIKYSYAYIALLFGGIIGFGVFVVGWTDLMIRIPWYVYLILFILWILALRRNFKKIKTEKETVTLTTEGLQSTLFGSVDFDDIRSYRISLFQAKVNTQHPVPTLIIKPVYGETIRFNLSLKHEKQDFPIFFDFVVRFIELMKDRDPESYQKAQEKLDQYEVVVQHPKRYWKRAAGWSTTILVIGLAISQFIQRNPELFKPNHVRELQEKASVDFVQQKKLLQQAIAKEGAVYLLSNDTTVSVRLIPNMEAPKAHYPGGPMFRKLDVTQKIKNFLTRKDSLGFHTTIDFGKTFIDQIPAIPLKKAPGMQYLYFTLRNKEGTDSTDKPLIMNWGIAYRDTSEIKERLNHSLPPFKTVVAHYLSTYPDCKLFVTAAQGQGTDWQNFKAAAQQVKRVLVRNKIDTSRYKISVFNEKE